MLLPQVIDEIKELKDQPNHRSSYVIFQLLENNQKRFLEKMEADNFNSVHRSFERLSEASAKEYNSVAYRDEFSRAHSLLMFYLDRII